MDALTFVSELVKSLAWPLTALAIAFLLRRPLAELIPLLGKIKYRDVELEFNQDVAKLNERTAEELPESRDDPTADEVKQRALQIIQVAPKAAIVELWRFVEGRFIDAARDRGVDVDAEMLRKPLLVGEALLEHGHIDENQFRIFHHLRLLRNQAVHYEKMEVSPNQAIAYMDSALRLGSSIIAHDD